MSQDKALLITTDHKTETRVKESLPGFAWVTVKGTEGGAAAIEAQPQLIIIDQAAGGAGGLQLLRGLSASYPQAPIILLSAENDIQTAVLATKAGAADFLKKPFSPEQLREAVDRALAALAREYYRFNPEGWLRGESQPIKHLHETIRRVLLSSTNIILRGEPGIDQREVVEFLHTNGLRPRRQLRLIDLASFRRENQEAHFWATVQEVLAETPGQPEEERCGTLYLENSAALEPNFQASIFDYFAGRRGETRLVIGRPGPSAAPKDYAVIDLPPLRERREDLPQLCGEALRRYAVKHNRPVSGFSAELLSFLGLYDFPGNYAELADLIEQGVLRATGDMLELKDLAVDQRALQERAIKQAAWSGEASLGETKRYFEVELYNLLLGKCAGDVAAAARFLDLPRTVLSERLTELS